MLFVAERIHVEPTERDAYVAACVTVCEQARAVDGCLDFSITADTIEADRINVLERWESDKELLAFRGDGPEPGSLPEISSAEVTTYRISSVEAP